MTSETGFILLVKSYQRLKMMPPYLTLGIIRYGSRIKWSNPGKRFTPSHTPQCSSYRNLLSCGFCRPGGSMSGNQRKRKQKKVLGPSQRTNKVVEDENDDDTSCNCRSWNSPQKLGEGTGRVGNRRTNRDHSKNSTVKIGKNTGKTSGDQRRLVVTETQRKRLSANIDEKNSLEIMRIIMKLRYGTYECDCAFFLQDKCKEWQCYRRINDVFIDLLDFTRNAK